MSEKAVLALKVTLFLAQRISPHHRCEFGIERDILTLAALPRRIVNGIVSAVIPQVWRPIAHQQSIYKISMFRRHDAVPRLEFRALVAVRIGIFKKSCTTLPFAGTNYPLHMCASYKKGRGRAFRALKVYIPDTVKKGRVAVATRQLIVAADTTSKAIRVVVYPLRVFRFYP
jgi:hypothetical protein